MLRLKRIQTVQTISPDLSLLGQAKPGDTITKITLREAQEKTREFYRFLGSLSDMLIKI